MSRRLGVVGVIMVLVFAVLIGQVVYLQYVHANALNVSKLNSRLVYASIHSPRGEILAADGTVLAESVPSHNIYNPWRRQYPLSRLTSGVVGFSSAYHGDWALEAEYAPYLIAHKQSAQSYLDLLSPRYAADSVQLTLEPALQQVAQTALAGRDGAVVALDPRNGDVLSMFSNPSFDPNPITATSQRYENAAWRAYNTPMEHGFSPLSQLATQWSFPPGSSFKVVTTSAVYTSKPDLQYKSYPYLQCFTPTDSDKQLCNDSGSSCGGNIAQMLPPSCDTGYALLGADLGGPVMSTQALRFGFDSVPPIDLPGGVVAPSYFPPPSAFVHNVAQLEYSAIGQQDVRATALQNALVAAGVANGGVVMTPHLMWKIFSSNEKVLTTYNPRPWLTALTAAQAAQVVPLMQNVVKYGTASSVGFLPIDDVAAKTGTAQTGTTDSLTDDWMIAFAPATKPTVAVAVVLPFQPKQNYGATIAGPVVKCVIEAALAIQAGLPAHGTATTCP